MTGSEGLVFRKSGDPVPTATVHKILRNRIYTGDFDWKGKTYRGTHTPLVSRSLWQEVQDVLDRRFANRHRKSKHEWAFSGLVSCGHCGCALVAEIKKGKYIYYHCTGYKGRCPERYTREEVLDEKFAEVLQQLWFDDEVMDWVAEALRQSHEDEKQQHDEAIDRLQAEYTRLQNRLDSMYLDKLDGRIDAGFFDRKAAEWREEQDRVLRDIETHQAANQGYMEEGVQLLELARKAHELFPKQKPSEKRRLLGFLLSNCTWKDGELTAEFRQPFDMLASTAISHREKVAAGVGKESVSEIWLRG